MGAGSRSRCDYSVLPRVLRGIHGRIGAREQIRGIESPLLLNHEAKTRGHGDFVAAEREGSPQGGEDLVRHPSRMMVNSSPPRRATVSESRIAPERRWAN